VLVHAVGLERRWRQGELVERVAERIGDQQHPDAQRHGHRQGADDQDDRSGHHQQLDHVDRDGQCLRVGESERLRQQYRRRVLGLAERSLDVDPRLVGHDHDDQDCRSGDGGAHQRQGRDRLRDHEFEEQRERFFEEHHVVAEHDRGDDERRDAQRHHE